MYVSFELCYVGDSGDMTKIVAYVTTLICCCSSDTVATIVSHLTRSPRLVR